jgi:hypothetical protein
MRSEKDPVMTNDEMKDHITWLSHVLQNRGLDPSEACAVMGNMIAHLIIGDEVRGQFLTTLKKSWKIIDGEKELLN